MPRKVCNAISIEVCQKKKKGKKERRRRREKAAKALKGNICKPTQTVHLFFDTFVRIRAAVVRVSEGVGLGWDMHPRVKKITNFS